MVILFLFIFGLCVGSFLSCWVYRINNSSSPKRSDSPVSPSAAIRQFLSGRSACDHCGKQLAWYDNLPLLSFLFLRGKSRCCRSPIPFQYPLVELACGILFVVTMQPSCSSEPLLNCYIAKLLQSFILFLLVALFISDLNYQTIPDIVIYPAILLSLIYRLTIQQYNNLTIDVLVILATTFLFFLLSRLKIKGQQAMGFGDVEIVILMGLFLGFPKIIVALYLAFLTGALVGVILIMLAKKNLKSQIAFGPFLVAGTMISFSWGEQIIKIFLSSL